MIILKWSEIFSDEKRLEVSFKKEVVWRSPEEKKKSSGIECQGKGQYTEMPIIDCGYGELTAEKVCKMLAVRRQFKAGSKVLTYLYVL